MAGRRSKKKTRSLYRPASEPLGVPGRKREKKGYSFYRPASKPLGERGTPGKRLMAKAPARWTFHRPDQHQTHEAALGDTGWHFEEETKKGPRWTCDYGCKSHVWVKGPAPWQYHTPDCAYWRREGREGRPLLFPSGRAPLAVPWHCQYGCRPFINPQGVHAGQYHAWNCDYWNNEGGSQSPF